MPVLGDRLKTRRLALKISLKEIADNLGIKAYQQYYDWEQGKHNPPLKYLDKLADVLVCSVDYLLGLVDDPGARLEESELSEEEVELIRRRRKDPYFREITDVLLRGIPIRELENRARPAIERGEEPGVAGEHEAA